MSDGRKITPCHFVDANRGEAADGGGVLFRSIFEKECRSLWSRRLFMIATR